MIYCDNCYENHLEFKGCPPDCKNCRIFKLMDALDRDDDIDIKEDGDLIEE